MDQAENLRRIVNNRINYDITNSNSSRVITITSGKGGVGKTNVAVNLAVQFQKVGKKVIIIDADFGLANIEVLLGIVPKFNLSDVINGRKNITDIIIKGPQNIKFISGGSGVQDLIRLNKNQLNYFIKNMSLLDEIADIILIDTGAGLTEAVLSFSKAAEEIVLVTTPEPTSITDAYALIKTLYIQDKNAVPNIKLLVNKVDNEKEGLEISNKLKQVSKKFLNIEIEEVGYIPYDRNLIKSVKLQDPVSISFPKSESSKAFKKIANKILNANHKDKTKLQFSAFIKRLMDVFSN
ncbi:MinD/ParA family protein [Defluviitalea phaphyphila]|uniref:MinD/ParA family protein n=1 Tax=Defluviitalea phaphyphila TaxID=1473580 RepID=UPI000730B10C|nr:MinD/ParA family protein [Defluviitalea phaphyphila]